jgi:biotin carboxyl carrier protein
MAKKFKVKVNNKEYIVEVSEEGVEEIIEKEHPRAESTVIKEEQVSAAPVVPVAPVAPVVSTKREEAPAEGKKCVKAPITGRILKIFVKEGQEIKTDEKILTLEAMKMENEICAPFPGRVGRIMVREGEDVEEERELCEIS